MTTIVEFGKDHYHLQDKMEEWCEHNIGCNPGYSNYVWSKPDGWEGSCTWCIASAFGNTFFYFKNHDDATFFALKWK